MGVTVFVSNPTTSLRLSSTSSSSIRTIPPSTITTTTICNFQRSNDNRNLSSASWIPNKANCISFRSQNEGKLRSQSGICRQRRFVISCGVTAIDQTQFKETVLQSEVPVLVEFIADWCGPCRLMAPAMDWASQEYKDKLNIVKIDHDSNPQLIETYKVYGLPALILFKDGQEVPESRREGAMTKVKLKEYVEAFLNSIAVA